MKSDLFDFKILDYIMSKCNDSESWNIVSHCERYWRSLRMYNVIDAILFDFFFFQGQFNFDLFASLTQGFRKLNATWVRYY